jgi:hypothetical protein
VCSVRGLYRAFPPPDPPVYVRPQLKPSHGICCFTTTIFGAHRGADQGTGRSTSGWDLLHLLGGSISAPPLSTLALLHLSGLTSTRSGRHTVVPNLLQQFRAGIFFPRPALGFPGPALVGPGRHISVLAGIRLFWPEYAFSWPAFASVGRDGPLPISPAGMWASWADPGRASWPSPRLGHAPAFAPAGPRPGLLLILAASRLPLRLGYAPAGPPLLHLGGPRPGPGRGWASTLEPQGSRQAGLPASWATPRQPIRPGRDSRGLCQDRAR